MEIQQEKKIDMKQKLEEKLSLYGLKVSDLTKDELRQLEEEIRLEEIFQSLPRTRQSRSSESYDDNQHEQQRHHDLPELLYAAFHS